MVKNTNYDKLNEEENEKILNTPMMDLFIEGYNLISQGENEIMGFSFFMFMVVLLVKENMSVFRIWSLEVSNKINF